MQPPDNIGDSSYRVRPQSTIIGVLGLWEMGYTDPKVNAKFFLWSPTVMRRFETRIRKSQHPELRRWLRDGLPPGVNAPLPFGDVVVCPKCCCRVSIVPCPACKLRNHPVQCLNGRRKTKESRLPSRPVKSPPGSLAKLLVMQGRLARGEQLFHPSDAQLPKEWHPNEPEQ
jgi:hypothetical protein